MKYRGLCVLFFCIHSGILIAQKPVRYKVDAHCSLSIDVPAKKIPEIFDVLRSANKNIVFYRAIDLGKDEGKIPFAVSRYESSQALSLDSAFAQETANFIPDYQQIGGVAYEYKIIEARSYNKNGHTLYLKMSRPLKGVVSVLYYFMKNNYSNVMYEIKISGSESNTDLIRNAAEKIALTVAIN